MAVTQTFSVAGMTCGHCEASVQDALGALPGVRTVSASHERGDVVVESDAPLVQAQVRDALDEVGYDLR